MLQPWACALLLLHWYIYTLYLFEVRAWFSKILDPVREQSLFLMEDGRW